MLCEVGSPSPFSTIMFSANAAGRTMSPGLRVDQEVQLGDHPAERRRAGQQPRVALRVLDHAVVGLVGVAADDRVDLRAEVLARWPGRGRPRRCSRCRRSRRRAATPSCSSTTIDLTPRSRSFGTSALAVSTSSSKSISWMPAGRHDRVGGLQGHADEGDLLALDLHHLGRRGRRSAACGRPGPSTSRWRRGTGSRRPRSPCHPGRSSAPFAPSPSSRQPPCCIRCSSRQPSSNSWLPTEATCRPILFMASMVGSSWNAAESSGEAPIRSPAATVIGVAPAARDFGRSSVEQRGEVGGAAGGSVVDPAAGAGRRDDLELAVEVVDREQVELDVLAWPGGLGVVHALGVAALAVGGRWRR